MTTGKQTPRLIRFGPIEVEFDSRVLTPRPWTMAQSVWAAELARHQGGVRLLEICAGAGHIGLAAAVLGDLDLLQVERDPVAAAFAAANARRADWAERVEVRVSPLQLALRANEVFPVILADPPYLSSSGTIRWPTDPLQAIDGGEDGLDLIRACLHLAANHLVEGGQMLLQVAGPSQADEVKQLLDSNPTWTLRAGELRTTDADRAVLRIDR